MHLRLIAFVTAVVIVPSVLAQQPSATTASTRPFILGADVSWLRDMEIKGVAFTDQQKTLPGLEILHNHGYTWVRLRIMNEPSPLPNTLAYTLAEARDAKALGFRLLLDFHYSDDWADPSHQKTPAAWARLSHDALVTAVFNFTRDTLTAFREQGTMPDMVQIGNEITSGMLWPDGRLPDRWPQFAELLAAGVRAVDAAKANLPRPAIMIHIDQGGNEDTTRWFFDNLILNHVPFDVIGQSYYPWWQGSLAKLRENLFFMAMRYKKPIFVVETAYDWRDGESWKGSKPPYPETPGGQAAFYAALIAAVRQTPNGLGRGVFWWEPMAPGPISKRAIFDDRRSALPVLRVSDPPAAPPPP